MSYKYIKIEFLKNGISILKLNRPEKLNAMNITMFDEINNAIKRIDEDRDVFVVIVKGEGGNFSSGLDFFDLFDHMKFNKDFDLWTHIVFMQDVFLSVYNSEKVYIAAIDGYCLGAGLDLASACDLRIATNRAKFSIAETKLGIVADLGVLQHLVRIVGEQVVRYWAYTSRVFGAEEAFDVGLILDICETEEELDEVSENLAKSIAKNPKKAVMNTKKSINHSFFNPLLESLRFTGKLNLDLDIEKLMERFKKGLK